MRLKSTARALLQDVRDRFRAAIRREPAPYRPSLADRAFLESLPALPGALQTCKARLDAGDQDGAARHAVEHFVRRASPAFFIDADHIRALALRLQHERPESVAALRANVDADLNVGVRLLSRRGAPLRSAFDWSVLAADRGDVLYRVQPHRFGFLPQLALAAHHGMDTLPVIDEVTARWVSCVSAGDSLAYLTPLVVQYRVLASSWTFAFVAAAGVEAAHAALFRLLKIIHADMQYLRTVIGSSYPNNHLLADGFAGWYCGTLYPELDGAAKLKEKGEAIFLAELERQFLADGSSFEHSTHYHELGCEMTAAYLALSRRNGHEPARAATERLERMLAFQSALCGPEAIAFPIGDSTEDPLFPLDAAHGWACGAWRELYRVWYDAGMKPPPAGDLSVERAWWLLGEISPPSRAGASPRFPVDFGQGGFHILDDEELGSRLVVRSGPVADLPISAGHAHADVLSIYLSVGGMALIVAAGTYTYRFGTGLPSGSEPNWRSYFAGPAAHNGLILASDPYGPVQGDFRDRDVPCRVTARRSVRHPGIAWLEFEVEGESVAAGHRRGVVHVAGHYWLVYDIVPQRMLDAGATAALQFAPGTRVQMCAGQALSVVLGGASCTLAPSAGLHSAEVLTGSIEPVGGWVSPCYGKRVPAPQWRARLDPGVQPYGFVVKPDDRAQSTCAIVAAVASAAGIAFRIADGTFIDTLLVRTSTAPASLLAWDVELAGSLLWQRALEGEAIDVRSIGGQDAKGAGRLAERRQGGVP